MYQPHRDEPKATQPPLIPPVEQPSGRDFFLKTWTGRIIIVNTLVFLLSLYLSPSINLLMIDLDVLMQLGAKDPVRMAQGDYWRLFAPMFIHGGVLHFAFNNWALYALGYQLEHLLKPSRYLALYLLAGIGGTVASLLTSLTPSVGASGALFGLLGCGLYVERTIQSRIEQTTGFKARAGAYTGMVVANILFGFIIPQIDNAAHIGGLVVGMIFAYALLRLKPNRLLAPQRRQGWIASIGLGIVLIGGSAVGSSPRYVLYRLHSAIEESKSVTDKYYYLDRWLELQPLDADMRTLRLAFALRLKDFTVARRDLELLQAQPGLSEQLRALEGTLQNEGFEESAAWLRRYQRGVQSEL